MALADTLKKLTAEDKMTILVECCILPAIVADNFLSKDEKGDIERAGRKLGFSNAEIEAAIQAQLKALGAKMEK